MATARVLFRMMSDALLDTLNWANRTVHTKNCRSNSEAINTRNNRGITSAMSPFLQCVTPHIKRSRLMPATLMLGARHDIMRTKIDYVTVDEEVDDLKKSIDLEKIIDCIHKIQDLKRKRSMSRTEFPEKFRAKCESEAPFIVKNYPAIFELLMEDDTFTLDLS